MKMFSPNKLYWITLIIGMITLTVFLSDTGEEKNTGELVEIGNEVSSMYAASGIDAASGLVIDEGYQVVKAQCGACHSTQLVTQNRFSREGWESLIRWMQAEQKLWDLGDQEKIILDYLAKHLSPKKSGRRKKLENIEWYVLNE